MLQLLLRIPVFPCDNNKHKVHKTKEVTFANLRVILKSGSNPETDAPRASA